MMSEIQTLELAEGIRERLLAAGYSSLEVIIKSGTSEISKALGVDLYVAKLIIDAAKRAAGISDGSLAGAELHFTPAE